MASFLALYRGETISAAEIVAVSADPTLVQHFAQRMLDEAKKSGSDAALLELEEGRRRALQTVAREAGE